MPSSSKPSGIPITTVILSPKNGLPRTSIPTSSMPAGLANKSPSSQNAGHEEQRPNARASHNPRCSPDAHRSSACCERQKGGPQTPEGHGAPARCMGRSRGGLTTKIHALVDGNGLPIALKLTEGQGHDGRSAADMLDGLGPGQILLADRGYDSDALRARLNERGAWANVKPMPNRVNIPAFSPFLYRYRNLVERFFNKIKHFRAVATRFEKHDANYLALVKLAAAKVWMRFMSR